jgi:hypothetical protein
MHMHPRAKEDDFLNNLRSVPVVVQQEKVEWVGFEPTTSAFFKGRHLWELSLEML